MQGRVWRRFEAKAAQLCERFVMRRYGPTAFRVTNAIGKEAKWPLRCDSRVELPQRTGRAVARVHVGTAAVPFDPLIEHFEVATSHEDLSAHLDDCWNGRRVVAHQS